MKKDELPNGRMDVLLITGDAYVDHPSFGTALIGRLLESRGYAVGLIAQPDWRNLSAFSALGAPRLCCMVTGGNLDSMVNHYTSARKRRSTDAYAPGGQAGLRPDRATTVYAKRAREALAVPVIIGGLEASLRRFAHYDYWSDTVRASILDESGADLLIYGMAERAVIEVADGLDAGLPIEQLTFIDGCCYMADTLESVYDYIEIASLEKVTRDKKSYAEAFAAQMREQDAIRGRRIVQRHAERYLVANPPQSPLEQAELDGIYALPFRRESHPSYTKPIPALEEVEFSITSARGCFGGCAFCALTFHQGRVIQARSHASIMEEARRMTALPRFKGYIHDVGGPTANFRIPACEKQKTEGVCANRQCLFPKKCRNLNVSHADYLSILRKLRALPKVKRVYVRSGLRYDYLLEDPDGTFLRELLAYHVSGQLKVAPEHIDEPTLRAMGKPPLERFEQFWKKFQAINKKLGKEQYLVPYFMSSHPGCTLSAAIELALYLKEHGLRVEQVQDFYPTPGTVATCMYHTGLDPFTMQPVYVPKGEERAMQRALLQYFRPQNHKLVKKALYRAQREDLIGPGKKCLVRSY